MALSTCKYPLKFPVLSSDDDEDLELEDTNTFHYHLPVPVKFPTLESPNPEIDYYDDDGMIDEIHAEQNGAKNLFPAQTSAFPATFYDSLLLPVPPKVQRVLHLFLGRSQQFLPIYKNPPFQMWETPKSWYQTGSYV